MRWDARALQEAPAGAAPPRRGQDEQQPAPAPRGGSFSSVRAVFWPLMSMRSDADRNDVAAADRRRHRRPPTTTAAAAACARRRRRSTRPRRRRPLGAGAAGPARRGRGGVDEAEQRWRRRRGGGVQKLREASDGDAGGGEEGEGPHGRRGAPVLLGEAQVAGVRPARRPLLRRALHGPLLRPRHRRVIRLRGFVSLTSTDRTGVSFQLTGGPGCGYFCGRLSCFCVLSIRGMPILRQNRPSPS